MIFRLVVVLFFFSLNVFSQENFTKHTVLKGDNIYAIAKQYGVKPKEIIDANPNNSKVLKLNSVLLIPTSGTMIVAKQEENVAKTSPFVHEILAKETLWGISKKYKISVEDLKKANPELEFQGLKVGQKINIPSNAIAVSEKSTEKSVEKITEKIADLKIKEELGTDVEISREVLAKETKYKIAKEFGITIAELEKQNPEIKSKLPVGYTLKIKTSKQKADEIQSKTEPTSIKDINLPNDDAVTTAEIERQNNLEVLKFSNSSELKDQLVFKATDNIGIRYRIGGTSKAGFDCSGLMCDTFGNFDIKLPRTSLEQSRFGQRVEMSQAQKGDLIFFRTNGRRHVNHVGMVVEVLEDEIKFVHASTHGGVMISSTKEGYYERAFSHVNRVLE